MNVNSLINMGMRMLMRKGVNTGINMAANRGKKPEDMTPEERQTAQSARGNAQNTRRGLGMLRRFMR